MIHFVICWIAAEYLFDHLGRQALDSHRGAKHRAYDSTISVCCTALLHRLVHSVLKEGSWINSLLKADLTSLQPIK